jgi:hypothetical protein
VKPTELHGLLAETAHAIYRKHCLGRCSRAEFCLLGPSRSLLATGPNQPFTDLGAAYPPLLVAPKRARRGGPHAGSRGRRGHLSCRARRLNLLAFALVAEPRALSSDRLSSARPGGGTGRRSRPGRAQRVSTDLHGPARRARHPRSQAGAPMTSRRCSGALVRARSTASFHHRARVRAGLSGVRSYRGRWSRGGCAVGDQDRRRGYCASVGEGIPESNETKGSHT